MPDLEYINHRMIERMNPNHPDNNNCEGDLERDAEGELIIILNHPRYKIILIVKLYVIILNSNTY